MLTREPPTSVPSFNFLSLLPPERHWRRVALVASGLPSRSAVDAARDMAIRHGGQLVVYDVDAAAGFTSPYPPAEDGWLPPLLNEAALRRVGKDDLADLARDFTQEELLAGVYLAPKTDAADLDALVTREGIDLVICLLPSRDRRQNRVHDSRRHAYLLLVPEDAHSVLLEPLEPGEELPAERIRWPYLLAVLATFFLARGRNRV